MVLQKLKLRFILFISIKINKLSFLKMVDIESSLAAQLINYLINSYFFFFGIYLLFSDKKIKK